MASAISFRSAWLSSRDAAVKEPSTSAGLRAPTIAAVTPGQANVQAMATDWDSDTVPRRNRFQRFGQRQVLTQRLAGEFSPSPDVVVGPASAPVILRQL